MRLTTKNNRAKESVDHLCRNRSCINPKHLEYVSTKENVLRGDGLAARNARKTKCRRGHKFTESNTYKPPKQPNVRQCRKCVRLRWEKYASKQREKKG